jgi:uncharacterized protein (TIGR02145 family)
MSENLDYGNRLEPSSQPQTDNCISEKYCQPADPWCSQYGGLYQWDELLKYSSTTENQGICPPEWHVPSEAEWQMLIDNIAAWFTPPANGLGGAFLKDTMLNPGFDAILKGIYYLNNAWSFTTVSPEVTMYWTSLPVGPDRAVARGMNVFNTSVSHYESSRGNAFPVRCIKNMP